MTVKGSPLPARAPMVTANGRRMALAAVVAGHAAALFGAVLLAPAPARPVAPPAVIGMLVSESASEAAPAPRPLPVAARATPVAPAPVATPPSERAPLLAPAPAESSPAPVPAEASESLPAEAAPAIPAESGGAAVTPPRSDAAHLDNPKPVYPAVSRRLKEEGRVVLEVFILEDGTVGDLRVKDSSGHERLDRAALAAVRRWKYVPARRGSMPIALWHTQSLLFSLVR